MACAVSDTLFARYGPDVENYLEVYLKTPGLSTEDMTRALLARGNARRRGGEKLLAKAQEGAVHTRFGVRLC